VLWSPANFIAPALPASAPQVATIHDLQHLWMPENFSLLQRVARDVLFRATLRRARAVIAISGFTRDDILARYGAEASRVHGILSGLDAAEAPGDEDEVRQRYDLQGPFLVFPAAMTPHKGHAFLLRAFARAVDGLDPRLRLVLTGQKTDLWPGLCAIIAEHGLEDRVHHLGFIPRGDMITLTAAATALVFPSRFEGFGLPLLEAMQHGTPVIASKVTAIPEVAGEGAALLDPDDLDAWASAMRRVVSEPEWAAELSRAGTENTRRFSWRTCAEATLTVLEQAARAN